MQKHTHASTHQYQNLEEIQADTDIADIGTHTDIGTANRHTHTGTHIHMCACTCMHVHVHTYMHTYKHTHTHTHTHPHTPISTIGRFNRSSGCNRTTSSYVNISSPTLSPITHSGGIR